MRHTRESVLERVTSEFALLDESVSKLKPADWKRPVGRPESKDPWTLKDALAHVTHWKAESVRVIRREKRSEGSAALAKMTINESNHRIYDEWKDKPVKDVLAWHRQVQDELVAAIREAPEAWFSSRDRKEQWPFDAVGHSVEHRRKDLEPVLPQART
jgi:hypothetical protein